MADRRFSIVMQDNDPAAVWAEKVALLEELGYEAAWLTDSQLLRREIYVCLAACALRTSRILLGTGVTSPVTRHVSVTAAAIASLEELAPGRLLVGVGSGNSSVRPLGLRPARVAELEEFVVRLRRMLAGEAVTFAAGKAARLRWLARPARAPVYIAATGPKVTRAAARAADGVILYQGITEPAIANGLRLVREGAQEAGRDPKTVEVILWACLGISADRDQARHHARGRVASVLNFSSLELFEGEDRETVARIKRAYAYDQHLAADPRHAELVPDHLLDRYAFAGTPDDIRQRLRDLGHACDIGRFILLPQATDATTQSFDAIVRGFSRDVMARLA